MITGLSEIKVLGLHADPNSKSGSFLVELLARNLEKELTIEIELFSSIVGFQSADGTTNVGNGGDDRQGFVILFGLLLDVLPCDLTCVWHMRCLLT